MAGVNLNRVCSPATSPGIRSCATPRAVRRSAACGSGATRARRTRRPASGARSPTTSTSRSGACRVRTAPSTSRRAVPSRSTDGSSGGSGRTGGNKRQSVDIIADSVQFLGSREGGENGGRFTPQSDVPADTADFAQAPARPRGIGRRHYVLTRSRSTQEKRWPSSVEEQEHRDPRQTSWPRQGRSRRGRRKSCPFCKERSTSSTTSDLASLRRVISDKGKIRSSRVTGACRRHQSQLANAVKRARELGLLPYVADR